MDMCSDSLYGHLVTPFRDMCSDSLYGHLVTPYIDMCSDVFYGHVVSPYLIRHVASSTVAYTCSTHIHCNMHMLTWTS